MKIAAIIPAFNEEKTIANVIRAAQATHSIDEIIVVDDGSSDNTGKIAKDCGVRVIRLKKNQGKGQALDRGVKATNASILVFIDADLINLTPGHLYKLIEPLLREEFDMVIGTVDRSELGQVFCWIVEKTESPFAGTRALKREFWEEIPDKYKKDYYIESVLTYFAKKKSLKIKPIILHNVTHLIKEKKHGIWHGIRARAKMFGQMALINIILRIR
ncbi:glycosyltransferase family 2 protein [bacterium]|nr:glycosyltransferase family 2 protein [bacterium]